MRCRNIRPRHRFSSRRRTLHRTRSREASVCGNEICVVEEVLTVTDGKRFVVYGIFKFVSGLFYAVFISIKARGTGCQSERVDKIFGFQFKCFHILSSPSAFCIFLIKTALLLLPALFARVRQAQPLFSRLSSAFFFLRFGHAGTTESRFSAILFSFAKFFFGFRSFVDCLFCVFSRRTFNIFGFGCLKVRAFLPHFFSSSAKVYGAGFGGERLLFRLFFI